MLCALVAVESWKSRFHFKVEWKWILLQAKDNAEDGLESW